MAAPRINPLPGLHNCLSGHQSSHTLSILSHHSLLSLTASDRNASLNDAVLQPVHSAKVHAATAHHLLVTVRHRRITVITSTNSFSSPQTLHFEEHAIAVDPLVTHHHPPLTNVAIAVSGYDGVYFTAFDLDKKSFDSVTQLPGTGGHKMVCLAIRDNLIAAANMDGRVALWRNYHSASAAALIVEPHPRITAGDRVTDICLCHNAFVVAWWSASLFVYHQNGHLVWASHGMHSISTFGIQSGTFLTHLNRFVVACHARGALTWIDVDAKRYARRNVAGDVKGFCAAGQQLFLWHFEAGLKRIPAISHTQFEQQSKPMTSPDKE